MFRPPTSHARAPRLGQSAPVPPPLQVQGCPPQSAGPLARAPGTPLLLPVVTTRGGPERVPGITPTHLYGAAPVPPPPPGARGAGRGARLPANTGGHRRYGGPPSAAPPRVTRRPLGAQGLSPLPDWELWRDVWPAIPGLPGPPLRSLSGPATAQTGCQPPMIKSRAPGRLFSLDDPIQEGGGFCCLIRPG